MKTILNLLFDEYVVAWIYELDSLSLTKFIFLFIFVLVSLGYIFFGNPFIGIFMAAFAYYVTAGIPWKRLDELHDLYHKDDFKF